MTAISGLSKLVIKQDVQGSGAQGHSGHSYFLEDSAASFEPGGYCDRGWFGAFRV